VKISVTELGDTLRCRRMWNYGSPSRLSLTPISAPRTELHIGSAIHHALAEHALGKDPLVELDRWLTDTETKLETEYRERVGTGWSSEERTRLDTSRTLCQGLVQHYFDRWGWDNPVKPYSIIAPELTFQVPLTGTDGLGDDGGPIVLVGTLDGLCEDDAGNAYLLERKTYSQRPNKEEIRTHSQMMGYSWAAQQLFGVPLRGALYDGINKKLPEEPTPLQDGKRLSRSLINTTAEHYVACVIAFGDDPMDPYYKDVIDKLSLRDRQGGLFHFRHRVDYSQVGLHNWGLQAAQIAVDIAEAAKRYDDGDLNALYPNRRWEGCWDCAFNSACEARQFGEDEDYILDQYFMPSGFHGYGTKTTLDEVATPSTVASLDDLRAMFKKEA
jgi:hypothetical protein